MDVFTACLEQWVSFLSVLLVYPAYFAGTYPRFFKGLVFFVSSTPALNLAWQYQAELLGINPFNTLMHTTGYWALVFLLITLTMTPARRVFVSMMIWANAPYGKRLSDWNLLIKIRRMLGLYVFFYASLHLLVYLYLEMDFDVEEILWDIKDRPFITAGMTAFILLLPLVATSTNGMMRLLKKNWRRIHRLIYPISIIAIVHYWWLSKVGVYSPAPYTIILTLLLVYRLVSWLDIADLKANDDGMEVAERKSKNKS